MDVALEAAVAYLRVLRIRSRESIAKENLAVTRANLQRAEHRV